MTWVLDASAIICWLQNEPGAERVRDILADLEPSMIHAVNLVEVQYYLLRRGQQAFDLGLARMRAAGVRLERPMNERFLMTATRLKAHHAPISLADSFAVAMAVEREATLVTTDRGELEKVDAAGVCAIEFLR